VSKKTENTGFICEHCVREVLPLTNGSYRNHCPFCLYSKHVDNEPGDRASNCKGLLKPINIKSSKKGYQIVHKCTICEEIRFNKIADNTIQADDLDEILNLMR